jgi:hypothetical protein
MLRMRPGTLDDTSGGRSRIWTRSAQPWFVFPEGVAKFEKQTGDLQILIDLWRNRADRSA